MVQIIVIFSIINQSGYTVSHCPFTICYKPMPLVYSGHASVNVIFHAKHGFWKKNIYFLKTIGLRIWSYTYGWYLRNINIKLLLLNYYYYYWSWIILYFIFSRDQWRPTPGVLRNFFCLTPFCKHKNGGPPPYFPQPTSFYTYFRTSPLANIWRNLHTIYHYWAVCLNSEHSIMTTNLLPPLARGFSTTFVCVFACQHDIKYQTY